MIKITDTLYCRKENILALMVEKHQRGYHRIVVFDCHGAIRLEGDKPFETRDEAVSALLELHNKLFGGDEIPI